MTVYVWPAELPKPRQSSWSGQRNDGRQGRLTDGPSGWRRKISNPPKVYGMELDLSRSELAVFDTFFDTTTRGGTEFFTMPDPRTDGWPLLDGAGDPMLDSAGVPILLAASWLCLFAESMPEERMPGGVTFRQRFSVKVFP